MNDVLQRNIDKHIPTIVKRVKGRKSAWLTAELKSEMNLRDVLHRKFLKSKSTFQSGKPKKQHSRNLLNESASDPGRFWKSLKKIFPFKGKVPCAKSFLIKNKLTANSKVIANGFCSFFSTVANKLKTKVLQIKDFVWAMPVTEHRKTYNQFWFKQVTVAEVFKYLKNLSRKEVLVRTIYQLEF